MAPGESKVSTIDYSPGSVVRGMRLRLRLTGQ